MSSFSALIQRNNIALGFTGVGRDPTGFLDVVESSFNMTQLNYNMNSQAKAQREASLSALNKIKELGLQDIYNDYRKEAERPGRRGARPGMPAVTSGLQAEIPAGTKQQHDDAVIRGRKENPELWNEIPTTAEIEEQARQNAQLSYQENEEVSRYASGFDAVTGGFVGGFGASLTDPVNVMASFIGAGAGKSLLQTTLTEIGLNMGVEAAMQPTIMDWQKELQQEYGLSDAALNVITAGMVGGAAVPIIRGVKNSARIVLSKISGDKRYPAEVRQAAASMERYEHFREADPAAGTVREDFNQHLRNIQKTAEAMESGRPVRSEEIYVSAIRPQNQAAREFIGINEERIKAQEAEIQKIKAELSPLAGNKLSRGERKQLRAEIRELKYRLSQISEKIEQVEKRKGLPARQAKKEAQERGKELAAQERAELQEKIDIAEQKLERNKEFSEAEADLSRLEQGLVPERFAERVNRAAERVQVQPVVERIPEPKKLEEHEELVKQGVLDAQPVERSVYEEQLEEALSDDAFAAMEAEFNRMLNDNPDLVVTLEDGTQRTLREIADEFESEESFISEISSCAIGRS